MRTSFKHVTRWYMYHARGVRVLDDLYVPRVLYVAPCTTVVLYIVRTTGSYACVLREVRARSGRAQAVSAGMPATVCTGAVSATTVASAIATVGPRCWRSSRHWVEILSPLGGVAPTRRIALFAKRQ